MCIISLLLLGIVTGCTEKSVVESSKTKKENNINFEKYFDEYIGTFKLYDITNDKYVSYNETDMSKEYSPASTFKILNSLIALQTNAVENKDSLKKWNKKKYPIDSWNQDHTLESAVKNSVVWYFQEVSKNVGKEKMQKHLNKVGYGNCKIGDRIDMFWLDGSLKISVNEQLNFITNLYKENLPFDKNAIQTVKNILVSGKKGSTTLSGKTGTFINDKTSIGWYIGYIVVNNKPYTFVTKIIPKNNNSRASGTEAREISKNILEDLGLY
jgi:beta-lactamase class D